MTLYSRLEKARVNPVINARDGQRPPGLALTLVQTTGLSRFGDVAQSPEPGGGGDNPHIKFTSSAAGPAIRSRNWVLSMVKTMNRLFPPGAAILPILVLLAAHCAPPLDEARAEAAGASATVAAPLPPAPPWSSEHLRDHPLAGRIYRPGSGRFISPSALIEALGRADMVLLGEKHDNADHHRLQHWVLQALIARGRRPAVAFEMFTADKAPRIAAHLAKNPKDAAGLGPALGWSNSGWPDWRHYEPIAQTALDSGLSLIAANLPRPLVRKIARQGLDSLAPALKARLGLARPVDESIADAMATEIVDAHCGMLARERTGRFVDIQRTRDAHMARYLADAAAAGPDGAMLITGTGHGRTDRGVPMHLAWMAPGRTVAALAMVEVTAAENAPEIYARRYGAKHLPFDFVWFTARHDVTDPCETFRKQMQKLKKKS
jgi:uncharacterized iron-regulated protein